MTKIKLEKDRMVLSEEIIGLVRKKVTKFGTGAKVDCPKKYLGKTAYLIICQE